MLPQRSELTLLPISFPEMSRAFIFYIFPKKVYLSSCVRIILIAKEKQEDS